MSKYWTKKNTGSRSKLERSFDELDKFNRDAKAVGLPTVNKITVDDKEKDFFKVAEVFGDGMKGFMFTPTDKFQTPSEFIAKFDHPELLMYELAGGLGQAVIYRKECNEQYQRRKMLTAKIMKDMGLEGVADIPLEKLAEVKRKLTQLESQQ